MGFPNKDKLKKMRKLLETVEPSKMLPKNASSLERAKYKMCERFSLYILENNITHVLTKRFCPSLIPKGK